MVSLYQLYVGDYMKEIPRVFKNMEIIIIELNSYFCVSRGETFYMFNEGYSSDLLNLQAELEISPINNRPILNPGAASHVERTQMLHLYHFHELDSL